MMPTPPNHWESPRQRKRLRPHGLKSGRKKVLVAYQQRKQDELAHPLYKQKVPVGLLWHVQARLLARVLRGDLERYVAYSPR